MSDAVDVETLRKVAEAATPGNWKADGEALYSSVTFGDLSVGGYSIGMVDRTSGNWGRDAEYIATFDPPTVLALLARLESAEKERDILRDLSRINSRRDALLKGFSDGKAAGFREGVEAAVKATCGRCRAGIPFRSGAHYDERGHAGECHALKIRALAPEPPR